MVENEHLGGSDLVSEWVGRERREMERGMWSVLYGCRQEL